MNYKAKYGEGPPGIKKIQRVSDVNAMGYSAPPSQPTYAPNAFAPDTTAGYNYADVQQQQQQINPNDNSNYSGVPIQSQQRHFGGNYANPNPNTFYDPFSSTTAQYTNQQQQYAAPAAGPAIFDPNLPTSPQNVPIIGGLGGQFAMLQQPMVQDMALQYGQKLADHGKQLVESQFEKYVPVTRLKYYFAVDNNYVVKKLMLIFFPFTQRDWSLKYDQDNPVQPRFDLNAPDLYIPTMAYITFVVLAGLVMGMQNQFTPEQLGIISSSALAYSIFELLIYSITLYVSNISTSLKTLDLLAFSGYKFVAIDVCILVSIVFRRFGYYLALLYSSLTLCFFLLRTLKAKILRDGTSTATYDAYGNVQQHHEHNDYSIGRKRKLYFLFLISGLQPVLSFFLSMHLIPSKALEAAATATIL